MLRRMARGLDIGPLAIGGLMTGNGVHAVPGEGWWANEVDGRGIGSLFDHNFDAVAARRDLAMRSGIEHHGHNEAGQVTERNSYGHDPRSIPG